MKLKSLALGTLTAVAGVSLPACNVDNGDKAELVAVLPITGQFRTKGYTHKSAVQDAVVMLEEAGIADHVGKSIALTLVDSGDDKEAVTQALEEFVAEKGGENILGIISSAGAAHEGSLRTAMREQIVHFEVSSGSDDEEFLHGDEREDYDMSFAFMTRGLCHTEAILTAEFLVAEFPGQTVALVRGSKAHDVMHTEVIRAELERLNAELPEEEQVTVVNTMESEDGDYALSYEVGNFQLELEQLMNDHQPDVIFWHLRGDDINLKFMQDTQAAGFEGALITCGMSRKTQLLSDEDNGGYLDYFADRLHFVMRAPPKTDELTTYKQEFSQRWAVPADTYTPSAFDAMMLLGHGLAATQGEGSGALRDAIVEVSRPSGEDRTYQEAEVSMADLAAGTDINYEGPSGPLDIRGCPADTGTGCPDTEKHFVPASYYIEVVRPGDGVTGEYQLLEDWTDTPIIIE